MATLTIENADQAKARVYDLNLMIRNAGAEIKALDEYIANCYQQAAAKNKVDAVNPSPKGDLKKESTPTKKPVPTPADKKPK